MNRAKTSGVAQEHHITIASDRTSGAGDATNDALSYNLSESETLWAKRVNSRGGAPVA